jgi:hypothetical protein
VGVGGYLSSPEGVLAQVARVRTPDGAARADGVSVFSYYQPSMAPPAPAGAAVPAVVPGSTPPAQAPPPPAAAPDRLDYLVRGAGQAPPAFTEPARVPPMPWLERPDRGFIAGTVSADGNGPVEAGPSGLAPSSGAAGMEGRTVRIRRTGWFRRTRKTVTDANGWFGMTQLAPGTYGVRLEDPAGRPLPARAEVVVTAGGVARVVLDSDRRGE